MRAARPLMRTTFPHFTALPVRTLRRFVLATLCLGILAGPAAAQAAPLPPVLTEDASATPVTINVTTNLTFSVTNPNGGNSLSGVAFTQTMPSGVQVASTGSKTCGGSGTVTYNSGSGTIDVSGISLSPGQQCLFQIPIKGTTGGPHTLTSGAITATESGAGGTASTVLSVVGPASLATSFTPTSIVVGNNSQIGFTVTNPNTVDLTGVAFSDSLPVGLTIATPNNLSTTCGGTVIAAPGSSSISLSGATVTASSSCTITASVTAPASGTFSNTTGAITSTSPTQTGNTANASLTAVAAPTLTTGFGAGSIKVGASTAATFTIHNPNAFASLNGIGFSDPLPAGLTVASPNGLTGSCGGGTITAAAGSSSISLSGATLAVSASCTFSVNVTGTAAGAQTNTTGAVTSTESGAAATASAAVNVFATPTISLSYADSTLALNATTQMTLTIGNPSANPANLTGVGVSDALTGGLVVGTPNNLGGSCSPGTVSAVAGSTTVSVSAASIAPGSTCTVIVDVKGTTVGPTTNTTGTVSSTEGGNGGTANASLTVALAPTLHISFTPSTINVGDTSSLSFNVQNNNGVSLTGIAFTDPLPAGMTIAPAGVTGSCGGGTITATVGTGQVSLSGATIPASGNCTFTVAVTTTTLGDSVNTTSAISSSSGGNGAAATATLHLTANAPTVALAYGAPAIALNSTTTMTMTITNPASNPGTLHNVSISDTLPSDITVGSPNNVSNSCGGTVTAVGNSSSVSLVGGTLAPGASCAVIVDVKGTTVGTQSNTTGNVSATESGNGATANASLTVALAPTLAHRLHAASITIGQTSTLNFTVANTNDTALTGSRSPTRCPPA